MLKMALGRAARRAREATVAAMTATAGCSVRLPGRPHPHFPEARSFTVWEPPTNCGVLSYFTYEKESKSLGDGEERGHKEESLWCGRGRRAGGLGPLHPLWLLILCSGL